MDKKDLKSPDMVTKELRKGFEWTTTHSKLVITLIIAFCVVGGGYSVYTAQQDKKERAAQETYYKVEREYLEKKAKFEQFEQEAKKPKEAKAKANPEEPKLEGIKATGDIEQDYGTVTKSFSEVIAKNPKSKAAKMAALHLADIESQYQKQDAAIETLKKVDTSSNDLLSAMVLAQLGSHLANKNDCKSALEVWSKVTSKKDYKFIHGSVMLNEGLCYENLGDMAKADASYAKVESEFKQSGVAKTAEKYRKLLKANSIQ